jgi:hypothetical protein
MTEIEKKALALVNEIRVNQGYPPNNLFIRTLGPTTQALCRAIEQHEAYKQEVSDAVEMINNTSVSDDVWRTWATDCLKRFIIPKPKPDPLVEAMADCGVDRFESWADQLRAALEARGLEIREKSDD